MTNATVRGVPASQIPLVWHCVEPILSRAILKHTDEDANAALLDLMQEKSQLWVIGDFDAVCLTQINIRQTVKVLWIYYVAGDNLKDWIGELVKQLGAFAAFKGCTRLEFTGRLGWKRVLEKHGFGRTLMTMRLDLDVKKDKPAGSNIKPLGAAAAVPDGPVQSGST